MRSNYFLEHYGVVGMKWGKHRTSGGMTINSNKPGNYDNYKSEETKKWERKLEEAEARKKAKKDIKSEKLEPVKKTLIDKKTDNNDQNSSNTPDSKKLDLKSTQEGLKDGKKLIDAGAKYLDDDRKKQSLKDLKSQAKTMSDDELRNVINRLSMEERYVSVMEKEGAVRAKTDFQKTLEIVGSVAAYADTAISIYDRIQQVRSK